MIVDRNQPDGTPTWIDLGVPNLEQAMEFYGAVFGWAFDVGPAEFGSYTTCTLRGRRIAAIMPIPMKLNEPRSMNATTVVGFAPARSS